mgnify:CR=1 FL=1
MTEITYININNKESGLSVRNKINALGTAVDSMSSEIISEIDTINNTLETLDTRLDTLEYVKGIIGVGTAVTLTSQSVSETPSKLVFMNSEQFKCGTSLTSNVVDNSITIGTSTVYTFGGSVTLEAGNGDNVSIEMYRNNIATGYLTSQVGKGSGNPITFTFYGGYSFNANDVLTLYVYSTGSSVTVSKSTMVLEEKGC